MENKQWKYKIGVAFPRIIVFIILFAVLAGISVGLRLSGNGAFIITSFFTLVFFALMVYGIYRFLFIKLLINEEGVYYQAKPGGGKYYKYTEIAEAWDRSVRTQSGTIDYCKFKTENGEVFKISYMPYDEEAVEYFLTCVNGEDYGADSEDSY